MVTEKISNPYLILLVLLGFVVLRCIYKPALSINKELSAVHKYLGVFMIIVICLFSVQDTDYFHYKTALIAMSRGAILHFEDVYYSIGEMVSYNYLLFRLVVWGSAFTFFCWSVKRLNVTLQVALFFFVAMYLTKFCYARASLAMSMGLLGYTFLVKPARFKWISYFLGIVIIVTSLQFHKSAIFMIPMYILSFFKLNKFTIGVSLFLFPLGYYFISEYGIALLMGADDGDAIANSAQGYLMHDTVNKGIAVIIQRVLERVPYYIILYIIISSIMNKTYALLPSYQRSILNLVIYVIAFSSLFLFNYTVNTEVMYYRFLYYSILPLSIVLPILLRITEHSKMLKLAYIMGFYATVYTVLYSFYNAYLSA